MFLRTLVQVEEFNEIYVFCSNPEIKKYLISNVQYLQRPEFLDTQYATPQQIIEEFMKLIDSDIYAVCHCTSPFVSIKHFQECVMAVQGKVFDSSFTAEKIQRLLWTDDNKPLNFDPANIPRTQDLKPIYNEVSAAYVFRKEVFIQLHRRIGERPHITQVSGPECIDIDYPEDFEIANAVYMSMIQSS